MLDIEIGGKITSVFCLCWSVHGVMAYNISPASLSPFVKARFKGFPRTTIVLDAWRDFLIRYAHYGDRMIRDMGWDRHQIMGQALAGGNPLDSTPYKDKCLRVVFRSNSKLRQF